MTARKSKHLIRLMTAVLACGILTGCQSQAPKSPAIQAENLMAEITPQPVSTASEPDRYAAEMTDFALRLLRSQEGSEDQPLVSPLSVAYALAMTANGAQGQTLQEMETVLGKPIPELNPYLHSYQASLRDEEPPQLRLADSIWFTKDSHFAVNQDFLQSCADYYQADIYKTEFNEAALRDINNWVDHKTDGMIPEILDQIPENALMYLVNAIAFDARWASPYESYQVRKGIFTAADGTQQRAEFMSSMEHLYLENENAVGVMKYYEGSRFAFAALLPEEGLSLSDYLSQLDGEKLHALLSNPQYKAVDTNVPKFEVEYSTELSEALSNMGMPSAFDPYAADFSALGTTAENICISRVLHKTYMQVNETGTKAAASTVIEMTEGAAMIPEEIKRVCLDRPFLYMILDMETSVPVFIGTLNNV